MNASEAGFTKGPWMVQSSDTDPSGVWINARFDGEDVGPITGSVCRVFSHLYMGPDEADANARLIVNAPALFEALVLALADEDAYERGERVSGKWKILARVALAKVQGK